MRGSGFSILKYTKIKYKLLIPSKMSSKPILSIIRSKLGLSCVCSCQNRNKLYLTIEKTFELLRKNGKDDLSLKFIANTKVHRESRRKALQSYWRDNNEKKQYNRFIHKIYIYTGQPIDCQEKINFFFVTLPDWSCHQILGRVISLYWLPLSYGYCFEWRTIEFLEQTILVVLIKSTFKISCSAVLFLRLSLGSCLLLKLFESLRKSSCCMVFCL